MQEYDGKNGVIPILEDTTNSSKLKLWERRIAIVAIIAASVGLLVCAGLLIQAYITQKPAFKIPGHYSFVYSTIGFLILIIGFNIAILADTKQKKHDYISAFIRAVVKSLEYLIW